MAGIDEVLERLVIDPDFRAQLAADPAAALAGYMLYDEDLEVLAATLSADQGSSGAVEQRTSKTTLAGLLAAFEGAEPVAGTPGGAHVAISLGDGRLIEAETGQRAGYFDGKLLRADETVGGQDDQPGDRVSADPASQPEIQQFEIQVATSDLTNAETVRHPAAAVPPEDFAGPEADESGS